MRENKFFTLFIGMLITAMFAMPSEPAKQMDAATEKILKASPSPETTKELIQLFTEKPESLDLKDSEGKTALEIAAERNNLELAQAMLSLPRKPQFRGSLIEAASSNHPQMVQLLLDAGTPVNEVDENEQNALMLTGDLSIAKKLINKGISLDHDADGKTAFQFQIFASKNHKESNPQVRKEIARTILKAAQEENIPIAQVIGKVPQKILAAIKDKYIDSTVLTQFLDEYDNLFVDAIGEVNRPIIDSAILAERIDILEELIKRGSSTTAATKAGWTPLMYAAQTGNTLIVATLMRFLTQKDIQAKNAEGETAQIIAMKEYIKTGNPKFNIIVNVLKAAEKWWMPLKK